MRPLQLVQDWAICNASSSHSGTCAACDAHPRPAGGGCTCSLHPALPTAGIMGAGSRMWVEGVSDWLCIAALGSPDPGAGAVCHMAQTSWGRHCLQFMFWVLRAGQVQHVRHVVCGSLQDPGAAAGAGWWDSLGWIQPRGVSLTLLF